MPDQASTGDQHQAETALKRIEGRLQHIHAKLHIAARMILDEDPAAPASLSTDDLERFAAHWLPLVPDKPAVKALVLHLLMEKYAISLETAPTTMSQLGVDDPEVRDEFQALFDQSLPALDEAPSPTATDDNRFYGLQWMYLKRGETLVAQGADSERIYILVEGLLRASTPSEADTKPHILLMYPGQLIGSLGFLTGEPHAATITALRDSDVVYITNADFDRYVQQHPEALRKLAVHALDLVRQAVAPPAAKTRSIAWLPISDGLDEFRRLLEAELSSHGKTRQLRADDALEMIGPHAELEAVTDTYEFVDWMEQQDAAHEFMLYVGDPNYPNWTRRCIEQSDYILLVARADESPESSRVEAILHDIPNPEFTPQVDLVLVHESRATQPTGTSRWLANRQVARHHHVALDHSQDFKRLGRHLRGRTLGIAFGGGGMRGLAHAGVIQALREHDIHCDIAGGTSAGAIIAALYGLELDSEAIKREAARAMDRSSIFQPTLPFTSVVTGHALNQIYAELFGDRNIEDLWIPVFTVAANLTRAEMTVKSTGSLQKAVRASTSLAGILPPAIDDNYDLLLDGGAFNNTPADVVREQIGSGVVLAVDLGYTQREFPKYTYNDAINGFRVLWSRINPFAERIQVPAIMDIMMRSNGLGGMNATAAQVAQADLVFRPPVTQFGLYDIEAADEIFAAGYNHAVEIIRAWNESDAHPASPHPSQ